MEQGKYASAAIVAARAEASRGAARVPLARRLESQTSFLSISGHLANKNATEAVQSVFYSQMQSLIRIIDGNYFDQENFQDLELTDDEFDFLSQTTLDVVRIARRETALDPAEQQRLNAASHLILMAIVRYHIKAGNNVLALQYVNALEKINPSNKAILLTKIEATFIAEGKSVENMRELLSKLNEEVYLYAGVLLDYRDISLVRALKLCYVDKDKKETTDAIVKRLKTRFANESFFPSRASLATAPVSASHDDAAAAVDAVEARVFKRDDLCDIIAATELLDFYLAHSGKFCEAATSAAVIIDNFNDEMEDVFPVLSLADDYDAEEEVDEAQMQVLALELQEKLMEVAYKYPQCALARRILVESCTDAELPQKKALEAQLLALSDANAAFRAYIAEVPQDEDVQDGSLHLSKEAFEYLKTAAENGNREAQLIFARQLQDMGDRQRAVAFLKSAARNGYSDALPPLLDHFKTQASPDKDLDQVSYAIDKASFFELLYPVILEDIDEAWKCCFAVLDDAVSDPITEQLALQYQDITKLLKLIDKLSPHIPKTKPEILRAFREKVELLRLKSVVLSDMCARVQDAGIKELQQKERDRTITVSERQLFTVKVLDEKNLIHAADTQLELCKEATTVPLRDFLLLLIKLRKHYNENPAAKTKVRVSLRDVIAATSAFAEIFDRDKENALLQMAAAVDANLCPLVANLLESADESYFKDAAFCQSARFFAPRIAGRPVLHCKLVLAEVEQAKVARDYQAAILAMRNAQEVLLRCLPNSALSAVSFVSTLLRALPKTADTVILKGLAEDMLISVSRGHGQHYEDAKLLRAKICHSKTESTLTEKIDALFCLCDVASSDEKINIASAHMLRLLNSTGSENIFPTTILDVSVKKVAQFCCTSKDAKLQLLVAEKFEALAQEVVDGLPSAETVELLCAQSEMLVAQAVALQHPPACLLRARQLTRAKPILVANARQALAFICKFAQPQDIDVELLQEILAVDGVLTEFDVEEISTHVIDVLSDDDVLRIADIAKTTRKTGARLQMLRHVADKEVANDNTLKAAFLIAKEHTKPVTKIAYALKVFPDSSYQDQAINLIVEVLQSAQNYVVSHSCAAMLTTLLVDPLAAKTDPAQKITICRALKEFSTANKNDPVTLRAAQVFLQAIDDATFSSLSLADQCRLTALYRNLPLDDKHEAAIKMVALRSDAEVLAASGDLVAFVCNARLTMARKSDAVENMQYCRSALSLNAGEAVEAMQLTEYCREYFADDSWDAADMEEALFFQDICVLGDDVKIAFAKKLEKVVKELFVKPAEMVKSDSKRRRAAVVANPVAAPVRDEKLLRQQLSLLEIYIKLNPSATRIVAQAEEIKADLLALEAKKAQELAQELRAREEASLAVAQIPPDAEMAALVAVVADDAVALADPISHFAHSGGRLVKMTPEIPPIRKAVIVPRHLEDQEPQPKQDEELAAQFLNDDELAVAATVDGSTQADSMPEPLAMPELLIPFTDLLPPPIFDADVLLLLAQSANSGDVQSALLLHQQLAEEGGSEYVYHLETQEPPTEYCALLIELASRANIARVTLRLFDVFIKHPSMPCFQDERVLGLIVDKLTAENYGAKEEGGGDAAVTSLGQGMAMLAKAVQNVNDLKTFADFFADSPNIPLVCKQMEVSRKHAARAVVADRASRVAPSAHPSDAALVRESEEEEELHL